jgi:DNA repair photolyase
MLGVLAERANPFSILTKSTLILRDLELLQAASEVTDVRVNFSIGTLDEAVWKATESGAPHPRRRVEAVRKLTDAGITTGVLVAPVLPGISDSDDHLEEVVTACIEAGAVSVAPIPLHLRPGVRDVFMSRLPEHRPDMVDEYERLYEKRSYLPKSYSQDLTARVRRIAAMARAKGRVIGASQSVTRRMQKQGIGPGRTQSSGRPVAPEPSPTLF